MVITPSYRLLVNDDDITERIRPYVLSLQVTDNEKDATDELSLVMNAKFKRPDYGDQIKVFLGHEKPLRYAGAFYVQATRLRNNQELTINATGIDFKSNIKQRRHQRYEQISLAKLANLVAQRHGLNARSDVNQPLINIDQVNESDMSLLNRLAQEHACVFNIKNSTLYFMREAIEAPHVRLEIDHCIDSEIHHSNTTFYRRCTVSYQDTKRNQITQVSVGKGEPELAKQGHFHSQEEALLFAQNALKRANQATAEGQATITGQVLFAGSRLTLDNTDYIITRVTHTINNQGWLTSLEFKGQQNRAL